MECYGEPARAAGDRMDHREAHRADVAGGVVTHLAVTYAPVMYMTQGPNNAALDPKHRGYVVTLRVRKDGDL